VADGSPSDLDDPSSLCSLGLRPHLMTGYLVQLFRAHFVNRSSIEEPSLADWLWKATDPGGIVIESITRWDPRDAMVRPALVVKRNDWQVERLGIDDRHMGPIPADGYSYYTTFLRGSHTLFCLANEPAEAERLCAEVYRELIQFGPVIRQSLLLHRFVVAEVGAPARVQEAAGSFVVPVSVAYFFEETWRVAPDAPVLKTISLQSIVAESP
jgi:hypothetical protein